MMLVTFRFFIGRKAVDIARFWVDSVDEAWMKASDYAYERGYNDCELLK